MIPRLHRFHGYNSLRGAYRTGRAARGPLFAVKAAPNARRRTFRVAVVVARKVNKSAVARNRIRRRLYEAVRELESDIVQPFDIVITVFSDSLLQVSYKELKSQLKKQLKQAGVLK